ncbi:MAG TPA: SGNH/GDSL hydrolase family protein [Anaerolineaceae bacterium]|nr:SGNH/GDSL hydrolase family protein [Anaerolineaceae bacterium]HPN53394.1 SGNH/GDSL hydrolase family protein [Anaerolineaceae bacterium]
MKPRHAWMILALGLVLLAGCTAQQGGIFKTAVPPTATPEGVPFATPQKGAQPPVLPVMPTPVRIGEATAALPRPTLEAGAASILLYLPVVMQPGSATVAMDWTQLPVLPVVSQHARDIYQRGLTLGTDPRHFSKVGDCQNIPQYFLGIFDDPNTPLYQYEEELRSTVNNFEGGWKRKSKAVKTGFNIASVLSPLYADPEECTRGETPLDCELRLYRPSIVLISMETWPGDRPIEYYELYLRQILNQVIAFGAVPIVATKADNLEGDHAINQMVARVAAEYDIPLWNFWAAVQPLPDHGLLQDAFHLTNGPNFFNDAEAMKMAWPVRNLTGLQTIATVWKAVSSPEP